MPSNIESHAEVILKNVITADQKQQARADVRAEDGSAWNRARLNIELQDQDDGALVVELSRGGVRRAVANLYGVSDTTIARGEKAARLFDPETVQAHPLLTFSYWKVVADAAHLADPLSAALEVVFWIEDYYEKFGKRPSVRTVEGWVYKDDNARARTVWRSRTEGVTDQLEKIMVDSYCPPQLRALMGWVRVVVLKYLETGESILEAAPVNQQVESKRKEEAGIAI